MFLNVIVRLKQLTSYKSRGQELGIWTQRRDHRGNGAWQGYMLSGRNGTKKINVFFNFAGYAITQFNKLMDKYYFSNIVACDI